jgi:hypothetical protein
MSSSANRSKNLGFWEGHLGVKNSSFEPKWRNAAPGTYRHEGREADFRCTQHGSLLCGSNRPLAAVTRLTAFGEMY